MDEFIPIVFGVLFFLVLVWFFLCHRLFKILASRHPVKYKSMGSPSVVLNNSPSSSLILFKFLFKKEWKSLNDLGLAALSKSMLVFFVVYMFGFLTLVTLILIGV
ncbi:hypothetical protein [Vreelandella sp. GE22]